MKAKGTGMTSWRFKLKLAAVGLLSAAALLPAPAEPAPPSACLDLPACRGAYTDMGCCDRMWNVGSDKNGLCRFHYIKLRGCNY